MKLQVAGTMSKIGKSVSSKKKLNDSHHFLFNNSLGPALDNNALEQGADREVCTHQEEIEHTEKHGPFPV